MREQDAAPFEAGETVYETNVLGTRRPFTVAECGGGLDATVCKCNNCGQTNVVLNSNLSATPAQDDRDRRLSIYEAYIDTMASLEPEALTGSSVCECCHLQYGGTDVWFVHQPTCEKMAAFKALEARKTE